MNTRIRTEDIRICDDGDLPYGFYFYKLTKLDHNGNEIELGVIQVYAKYKGNSIHIFWDAIQDSGSYYRLYRGKSLHQFDGSFNVYPDDGYFCDNGMGVLNLIFNGTI
jgi:hypothetical protein